MQLEERQKMIQLFHKYWGDGMINITQSIEKTLEYSPLHDELSFDSTQNISTTVTFISNHKKSVFSLDGYSLEKIEYALKNMAQTIAYWEYDTDIVLPEITDMVEKDFSAPELDMITFEDLKKEFEVYKNYSFAQNISREWFSIGVHTTNHIFINSLWAYKVQKDNGAFYYVDILWENGEKKENHYEYVSTKSFPHITQDLLSQLEKELLFKISDSQTKLQPGKYDITLERDVVIDFLDIILWNLGAESMREWMSLFSKYDIGDTIFWDNFTLINNPELQNYTGTMLFDKEWITAKKTVLFEKWILTSKFYDYKNALKEWLQYLGNSTVSNIELIGEPSKNYLQGCRILFTNLMAFHTVDESTWKFSLSGEGYLLENGEKKEYIKNVSLSWNIVELFSSIKAFWDDIKTDGNFKVPSMSFKNQTLI